MKIPPGLQPLVDDGLVDDVLRPLKSGKEAAVYVVRAGGSASSHRIHPLPWARAAIAP